MSDLLFETPWWLPTGIIVLGIALFISGNARQISKLRNVGLGVVLLGLILILVSYLVETDKEICVRQTRQAVTAVQDGDWKKFEALLDPHASLDLSSVTVYTNRADLVKGAQDGTSQHGLKSVTILGIQGRQTQSIVTVGINVVTVQDATMGRPVPSSWELEWQKSGKDWRLYRLTCIRIADMNLNEMRNVFPR